MIEAGKTFLESHETISRNPRLASLVIFLVFLLFQLTYSILSGDPNGNLGMTTTKSGGKYLGEVTVAKPLDRETKDLYKLIVSRP